jgi:hypothetical protein
VQIKSFAPAFGFKKHVSFSPTRKKILGFRLHFPLPAERNHARSAFKRFFSPISLHRIGLMISPGQNLRVFDALSLIYSTFFYHGF